MSKLLLKPLPAICLLSFPGRFYYTITSPEVHLVHFLFSSTTNKDVTEFRAIFGFYPELPHIHVQIHCYANEEGSPIFRQGGLFLSNFLGTFSRMLKGLEINNFFFPFQELN